MVMLVHAYSCVIGAINAAPINEGIFAPRFGLSDVRAPPADFVRLTVAQAVQMSALRTSVLDVLRVARHVVVFPVQPASTRTEVPRPDVQRLRASASRNLQPVNTAALTGPYSSYQAPLMPCFPYRTGTPLLLSSM